MDLALARKEIEDLLHVPGPYNLTIMSMVLRKVAEENGYKEANTLIRKFKLESKCSIHQYWPAIELLKNNELGKGATFKSDLGTRVI